MLVRILLGALCGVFLADMVFAENTLNRPNVLFIAMDDLNDWVGCLGGNPQSRTPNLDRLAAGGVLFTNAHCPAPACNPCRSAIFTGRSPNKSGMYDNRQKMREVMPTATLIPQYFRDHGYRAAGSGKLLHYFIDASSWDEYFPEASSENPFPKTFYPEERPVNLSVGGPWQYVETDWAALDVSDEEYGGDWSVSQWIGEQLSQRHNQPFFLGCGFYRPHEPWFVPKQYYEPFPLESTQLPSGYKENDLDDVPEAGVRMAKNRYFEHIQQQNQWRQGVQGYLASIHFADAMLGHVLNALESGPNADNTIVVLWSDHGWQLGEKEHWQKFTGWRAVTRVPLMIRVPKSMCSDLPQGTQPGSKCDAPVNLLSLFPTLLELCELPSNPECDGPSLMPLLKNADADWPDPSITYLSTPGSYAISGRTHRYIHYSDGGEELYDIKNDPYEWTNLAEQTESTTLLADFRQVSPQAFAPRVEPSVESLTHLAWHAAKDGPAPASQPDGNQFDVYFDNHASLPVELFWMDREGQPKPYGLIEVGKRKKQQTRPGAVWMLQDTSEKKQLGYFVVGDRTARAVVPEVAARKQPNIIVILTDDQGYADLGVQGVLDDIKTPHIDSLGESGVRCTAGYITSPQCSPSRAGLMTGRYQARFGVEEIALCPLPAEEVTLAERLKMAGYRTGFVGKWHLDVNTLCANWLLKNLPSVERRGRGFAVPPDVNIPFSPHAQGFDDFFSGQMVHYHANFSLSGQAEEPPQQIIDDRFRVDVQSDAAVAFIEKNYQDPFYLHLCYYAPHVPLEASDEYLQRFSGPMPERRRYALAMLSAIDDGVGRILRKLREHHLERDTLIFFVSDNGAPLKGMRDLPISNPGGAWDGSRNDPLAGEKGMLLEGGIRVPFLIRWPDRVPAGGIYERPVISLDIAATAVAAANLPISPDIDGTDLLPFLRGEMQSDPHDALYWRFWSQTAVRAGDWKLVRLDGGAREMLFDLAGDESEKNDQLADHPERASELRQKLIDWEKQMVEPKPRGGLNLQEQEWFKDRLK